MVPLSGLVAVDLSLCVFPLVIVKLARSRAWLLLALALIDHSWERFTASPLAR